MMLSALLVADYLLAHSSGNLTPVHVLKMTYFCHAYTLARKDRPLIIDQVEAWRYGPVYPILYDYVKNFGDQPVTHLPYCRTGIFDHNIKERKEFLTRAIVETDIPNGVLETFSELSGSELIELTHKVGSPWDQCYVEGANRPIPDRITKEYYKSIITT